MAHHPRFLEIQKRIPRPAVWPRIHVHVSVPSRRAPALLHVNKEARDEGLKIYQLTEVIPRQPLSNIPGSIYYNPVADIFFFGESTCSGTMWCFLDRFQGSEVPRIAIMPDLPCSSCNAQMPLIPFLHDTSLGNWLSDPARSWPGLKEVFVVVPSNLWSAKGRELDRWIGYRETSTIRSSALDDSSVDA